MQRGSWPRWQYLYFALAAFDVFVVCAGLYLTHSIVRIYTESVAVNQAWAERVQEFSELGELAARVNAPGNDVFDSHDVRTEAQRMQDALRRFHLGFARLRRDLELAAPPAEERLLLAHLDAVGAAMNAMVGEARPIFAHFAKAPGSVMGQMTAMDRRHAELNAALGDLRYTVATIQQRQFEEQTAAALALERREALLGVLVLLMVAGATFYGRRLVRRGRLEERERERALRRVAAARGRLEVRSMQLELSNGLLRETQDRLQALMRRMLQGQEAQRRHVARELHEDVAQMLACLKMRLGDLRLPPELGAQLEPQVRDASTMAESAIDRLRGLVRDLAPHGMEAVGLAGILVVHLEEWTRGTGLAVEFSERLTEGRPCFTVETAAYRVVEEAVANAVLHAQARTLRVALVHEQGELHVCIEDDGTGFDLASSRRDAQDGEGMGLLLMEQRTALAGGRLEIASGQHRGTLVRAIFPAAD